MAQHNIQGDPAGEGRISTFERDLLAHEQRILIRDHATRFRAYNLPGPRLATASAFANMQAQTGAQQEQEVQQRGGPQPQPGQRQQQHPDQSSSLNAAATDFQPLNESRSVLPVPRIGDFSSFFPPVVSYKPAAPLPRKPAPPPIQTSFSHNEPAAHTPTKFGAPLLPKSAPPPKQTSHNQDDLAMFGNTNLGAPLPHTSFNPPTRPIYDQDELGLYTPAQSTAQSPFGTSLSVPFAHNPFTQNRLLTYSPPEPAGRPLRSPSWPLFHELNSHTEPELYNPVAVTDLLGPMQSTAGQNSGYYQPHNGFVPAISQKPVDTVNILGAYYYEPSSLHYVLTPEDERDLAAIRTQMKNKAALVRAMRQNSTQLRTQQQQPQQHHQQYQQQTPPTISFASRSGMPGFQPRHTAQEPHATQGALTDRHHRPVPFVAGISPNYQGNWEDEENQSANIPPEKNCSFWITGLPLDTSYKKLLRHIRGYGRIYNSHINSPEWHDGMFTKAAKLTFVDLPAASRFYSDYVAPFRDPTNPNKAKTLKKLVLQDEPYLKATIVRNRIRVAEHALPPNHSRVLIITGSVSEVHPEILLEKFKRLFIYDVDSTFVSPVDENDHVTVEVRLGRYPCQADPAYTSMIENPGVFRYTSVRFGIDPCGTLEEMPPPPPDSPIMQAHQIQLPHPYRSQAHHHAGNSHRRGSSRGPGRRGSVGGYRMY